MFLARRDVLLTLLAACGAQVNVVNGVLPAGHSRKHGERVLRWRWSSLMDVVMHDVIAAGWMEGGREGGREGGMDGWMAVSLIDGCMPC